MRGPLIMLFLCLNSLCSNGQSRPHSLEELLNFTVGGVWVSENESNDGKSESFDSFYMEFRNWSSRSSVTAEIFGVRNNGDTSQLIQVWNYINQSENNIYLVQRTVWGAHCTGTISAFEGKHLDINFKTTNPDGTSFDTRDVHYILSENEMRAETFHRKDSTMKWEKSGESLWQRKG